MMMSLDQTPMVDETTQAPTACSATPASPCAGYAPLNADEISLPRRGFLAALVGLFAAVWAVVVAGPVLGYLWPKQEVAVKLDRLVLGKAADFPPGSSKNFKFGSVPGLFIHTPEGKLFAYNATCSHLGCTVQYVKEKKNIYCACHGGTYDPANGNVLAGPPPAPLSPLVAVLEAGDIVIKPAVKA
jgi:cytochrome b6-f complex iron-sulfur subunit